MGLPGSRWKVKADLIPISILFIILLKILQLFVYLIVFLNSYSSDINKPPHTKHTFTHIKERESFKIGRVEGGGSQPHSRRPLRRLSGPLASNERRQAVEMVI
ncbi:hypothetical protein L1987_15748 [Smallanthus sonchifolius]|uniref:Uncharacterized protein n=1 Tax=Smallanthus sonchifolius TaxID=185202 RepID=A0ACB9J8Q2_9ASTR|nr:hypothetical protein L1987_15748 [Smallanthus sonchifolius]